MKHSVHEYEIIKINDGNIYKDFENYQKASVRSAIGNLENRNIYFKDSAHLANAGNNVGIIEFKSHCIELRPKLDKDGANESFWQFLPRMLHVLSDYDKFSSKVFIDPKQIIQLPRGVNIVPLLAVSLASLCSRAIEKGFYKKYIQKTSRLKKVKGKINFAELSRDKPWDYSTIPCTYYELTFDNPENQIILWCIHKLLRETQKILSGQINNNSGYIVNKLREQYSLLSEEIKLIPKTYKDILDKNTQNVPTHYIDLLNICKAILGNSLFSFTNANTAINYGVNFVIDMDWVFEQYLTYLFYETIKDNSALSDVLYIKDQHANKLCDGKNINIRPDLIIYKKADNKAKAIIDFKWKHSKNNVNADYYQVICYGLAELQKSKLKEIDVCLFAVDNEDEAESISDETFDVISKIFEEGSKSVRIKNIALSSKLLMKYSAVHETEKLLKENIRQLLLKYT